MSEPEIYEDDQGAGIVGMSPPAHKDDGVNPGDEGDDDELA